MKNKLAGYAPFILVAVYPLGMALQNIGAVLALLFLLPLAFENRDKLSDLNKLGKSYVGFLLALIAVSLLATFVNPSNTEARIGKFVGGYLGFILLPVLFYLQPKRLVLENKEKLYKLFVYGTAFTALVCISQKIWGWQISGSSLVFSEGAHRPRGLYSHPLTCAYVALVFWPVAVGKTLTKPKEWRSWLLLVSMVITLVLTSSRTVQVVCVATMSLQVFFSLRGKERLVAIALVLTTLAGVAFTQNPISDRFKSTVTHESDLRSQGYPDDRVAFWHVFVTMIKQKPIIGHGIDLNTKYRTPYYEQLGLGEFKKKYSAHNMFLQVTAEAGFVGLALFCAFLLSMLYMFLYSFQEYWLKMAASLMLFGFVTAALTQNAIQDSIVKNALLLWIILSFDCLAVIDKEKI